MTTNVEIIHQAYAAYSSGDTAALLSLVAPDLEWTYLDPSEEDPRPRTCHGRQQLEIGLERQSRQGLHFDLEDVVGQDDKVFVTLCTPGLDKFRARTANDRTFDVLTLRDGQIVALRACRSRDEALALISGE